MCSTPSGDRLEVALALGSNLGNRHDNLRQAIELLRHRVGTLVSLSTFHETAPEGYISSSSYLNAAAVIKTALSLEELLIATQAIEHELGRQHKHCEGEDYSDRTIDIDILLYGNALIEEGFRLTIPHPRMHLRGFVLAPLAEILPLAIHPRLGKTIQQLLGELDRGED